jgi:hypothetical protein
MQKELFKSKTIKKAFKKKLKDKKEKNKNVAGSIIKSYLINFLAKRLMQSENGNDINKK